MSASTLSPSAYLQTLSGERMAAMSQLREVIRKNLPNGFEEIMNGNMISFVVPHKLYPAGYHCDPKQPLPFLSIASQKNFIALYHMGLYADPVLLQWFQGEYGKRVKTKLDMGKSCIRFKKESAIPYELIGELVAKVSPKQWIQTYERELRKA